MTPIQLEINRSQNNWKLLLLLLSVGSSAWSHELKGPLETGWNNEKVCKKLSENKHQQIIRCTFPPGVGHEKHKHNANFGYAISGGKMQIVDESGSRVVDLKTNSHFQSKGTDWHRILNVGETTIVYLIIESI